MSAPSEIWFVLDEPTPEIRSDALHVVFRGWIAAGPDDRIGPVTLLGDGIEIPLHLTERPDVRGELPHLQTTGFSGALTTLQVPRTISGMEITFDINGETQRRTIDIGLLYSAEIRMMKERKLDRIRPLLQCPLCGSRDFSDFTGEIACARGHHFPTVGGALYDFLTEELRMLSAADQTDNVSAHTYDGVAAEMIGRFPDGLILDAGAGLRDRYLMNVVNMDIVDYATTDVLAVCERMPFADASFDAVLSLSVLEHVRDPFAAAREMTRVLKPGGTVYAAVPFLQPFHGYPNHYYNMTSSGLRNLFSGLDVREVSVPPAGLPIYALSWILRAMMHALPPKTAAAFKDRRIGDLLADPAQYLNEAFVRELPAEFIERFACFNILIGVKPAD